MNRRPEAIRAGLALAQELGQIPRHPEFRVESRSRAGVFYDMVMTPEGIPVHVGEGCEAELFHGPTGCWHSKEYAVNMEDYEDMTSTAVQRYEAHPPAPIEFTPDQLQVITSTIAKGATPDELKLFLATCVRTRLDPFLKQIYAIKRWDSKEQREVMAIQIGIDGLRAVADRTDRYAGQDPIEWLDEDGVWSEVWTGRGAHPIAARAAVYRKDWVQKAPAVCRWDSYAQTYRAEGATKLMPNWERMPDVMLGKCAEALALRRAFPVEMAALGAELDSNYDPDADAELQQAIDATLATVEGEVVSQGAPAGTKGTRAGSSAGPSAPPTSGKQATSQPATECEHNWVVDQPSGLTICTKCNVVYDDPPR